MLSLQVHQEPSEIDITLRIVIKLDIEFCNGDDKWNVVCGSAGRAFQCSWRMMECEYLSTYNCKELALASI